MAAFSIRNPYFIVVICLAVCVLGVVGVAQMPVDLFPEINLPQVVVATFCVPHNSDARIVLALSFTLEA